MGKAAPKTGWRLSTSAEITDKPHGALISANSHSHQRNCERHWHGESQHQPHPSQPRAFGVVVCGAIFEDRKWRIRRGILVAILSGCGGNDRVDLFP
jgi:hypothetical protein